MISIHMGIKKLQSGSKCETKVEKKYQFSIWHPVYNFQVSSKNRYTQKIDIGIEN